MRSVDRLFERYGEFHRHPVNKAVHWVCVPLILWSVLGMAWSLAPLAAYAIAAAVEAFVLWLSRSLALGMLLVLAAMLSVLPLVGSRALVVAATVFALAWVGQFVGHIFERRKPAFLEDLRSLLVAPAWLLAFLYRRLGIAY
jgi:uncharacterized membrane protein YGL010W